MFDLRYATQDKNTFFDFAKQLILPESCVLDIGAGNGSFAKHCGRNDFYLFDGNIETVEKLKKEHPNSLQGYLPELPYNDSFFDLIHCSHVLEHLDHQTFYESIKEIDRCLKRQGYLVISTPLLWDKFYDDLSHVKPYTPYIFIKYLTLKNKERATRMSISEKYSVEKLQYRYREVPLTEDLYNINANIFIGIVFKFLNLLYRLGLRKYIKNGFTIVLKKG